MSNTVEFSFRLTGFGWAEGRIAVGGSSATLTASCLESDALRDLVRAVSALVEGAPGARALWDAESAAYRWFFQRIGGDVRVRLLVFPDSFSDAPDDVLLNTTCLVRDLGVAIASGAQSVLDEVGARKYKRRWGHPFPRDDLAALQGLLHSDPP